jgi:hypothetical protein
MAQAQSEILDEYYVLINHANAFDLCYFEAFIQLSHNA